MTGLALKIIAMIAMIIDHTGDTLAPVLGRYTLLFNGIGRISFPLFAFLIVEGYRHTHSLKKYILRLFILGVISEIPYYFLFCRELGFDEVKLDVMFTLVFALMSLYIWDYKPQSKKLPNALMWTIKMLIISLLVFIATILKFDFGKIGIVLTLMIYLFLPNKKIIFFSSYLLLMLIQYLNVFEVSVTYGLIFTICSIIPTIFMLKYNGLKGKDTKYFLYIVYPLHILILGLIKYFLL